MAPNLWMMFTVIRQLPVFDPDNAVCDPLDSFIMGSDDDADTLFLHCLPQQAYDYITVIRIEIGRGLISEDDPGVVYKGAGKSDALFFSSRKILREVIDTMAKTYIRKDFNRARTHAAGTPEEKIPRKGDIFPRIQCGQEIEALEDKSYRFPPKPGVRSGRQSADLFSQNP